MRTAVVLLVLSIAGHAVAQDYTTPNQFNFTVEPDVVYGVDTNYLGLLDTLRLDVYKPVGNPDAQRPLVVFVHGGSWLGGCKDDALGIVNIVQQFVTRGYVAASANYRLGWHKDDFVMDPVAGEDTILVPLPPFFVSWPQTASTLYALDSAEIKRAIYRGMQDTKGAIRYMKARAAQDSVCVDKVFVGGESAGGFVALATAYLDRDVEKPAVCGALPDAPLPWVEVNNGIALNCISTWHEAQGPMLARPDLGPVEGDLNLNGFDARVRGVANFYGGVPQEALDLDWWYGTDTPATYLYHESCDGVVPSGHGQLQGVMSQQCNLGFTPWHYNYPHTYGSVAIADLFNTMGSPPPFVTDIVPCAPFDWNNPLFECARFADNGSYHRTVDHSARAQILSGFWASIATEAGACLSSGSAEVRADTPLPFPQPADTWLRIPGVDDGPCSVYDASGRSVVTLDIENGLLNTSCLPDGLYVLAYSTNADAVARIVVRHE